MRTKNYFKFAMYAMLVAFTLCVTVACRDDKDAPNEFPIGTWVCDDYPKSYAVFKAGGRGYVHDYDEGEYYNDYFTWTYSEEEGKIYYIYDDDADECIFSLRVVHDNLIIDEYGYKYHRK